MDREAFVKKWRTHIAGMALFGVASDAKDGTMKRAAFALDIPAEVDRVLNLIYSDLAPKISPVSNGTPTGARR